MRRRDGLVLAAGLLLGPMLPAARAAARATVTELVFEAGLFANVEPPSELHYRFEMNGRDMKEPAVDHALMKVRRAEGEQGKEVWLDLFTGPSARHLGPLAARRQNPLVLVFLQMDVGEMGRLTGGAPGYFQRRIRRAFSAPAAGEEVTTVRVGGAATPARRLTMRPFSDDPEIARFPVFRDKTYEFVVAPDVPGGLYRIGASTPDPRTGEVILEKSLTFERIER